MAKTAACPSCGAPVTFRSVVSVTAVCDYCQSTLVRSGEEIENIGKMAAFLEDRSLLQRGSEGRWKGRHFGLIGRLQLRYDAGHWNEWHLLFDDGKSGWLSEAGGEFVLSEPVVVPEDLPKFEGLAVGEAITLKARPFTVTNILTAECVAGEGELPFKVGPGYPAPVVDLRDSLGNFATLDYSDVTDDQPRPLVFIGEPVELAKLAMANLREASAIAEINTKARTFQCPSCGAPLSASGDDIQSVACGSCGAIVDTSHEVVKLLSKIKSKHQVKPPLELGTKGTLRGEALEIIGVMRRKMQADGVWYYWWEFVALAPDRSLRWLTEYTGHWNLARVQTKAIAKLGEKLKFDGEDYKHFQTYTAGVDMVMGEFPWIVRAGEQVVVHDYIAPPKMLSREVTGGEETWTLSEYLSGEEIAAAFAPGKPLAKPVGVFANQPNPKELRHKAVCKAFWAFFALAWIVHIGLLVMSPGPLVSERARFDPNDDEPRLTKDFVLPNGAERLEVAHDAQLSNNWVGLHLTLVNKTTGQAWETDREIAYYEGVDGGESWSEGSKRDDIVFTQLPPGTYTLAADAEMDPTAPPVSADLKIAPSGPRWSSLIILLVFLAIFPVWTRITKGSFEVKRWAESDHPIVTTSSDDD
jgi:hypothetical protein